MFKQTALKKQHLKLVLSAAAACAAAIEANGEIKKAKRLKKAVINVAQAFDVQCDCPKCQAAANKKTVN